MRNITLLLSLVSLSAASVTAQTLTLRSGSVEYSFPAASTGEMQFIDNGKSLKINDFTFPLERNTLSVDERSVTDNLVSVSFDGKSAVVNIAGNIAPYVSAKVNGAHVVITQSDAVSESTCGEITYQLAGGSDDGSLKLDGSYKATIELNGVALSNPSGAALDIQNGKRIAVSAKSSTVNTLSDGKSGDWKGTIVCKGHLEFKGKGTLDVVGNTAHAIYSKEYVEMKNLTLNITGSVKDGINCTQYFSMDSGSLNIASAGDDAVQVDYKDSSDREDEDTGSFTINGGSFTASVSAQGTKGVKTEGDILINGGEITITTTANGLWDSSKQKTKASSALGADGDVTITAGTLRLTASGSGGKGISCDGVFNMTGGTLSILTSGGIFAYVNNQAYDNYTGNTDRLSSDQKSSPKGIKADTEVRISGGEIAIECQGNGGEGIESKGVMTIEGGTIDISTVDDCINTSSTMYIKGGDITVVSSGNDGLDSNGDMYISGGIVRSFGAGGAECGIDVNDESGYKLYFTGGTIIAAGGNNSTPGNSQSTQPYVSVSLTLSAGQTVSVKSGSTEIASFIVPTTYTGASSGMGGGRPGPGGPGGSGSSVMISCPAMVVGQSYTVSNGSSSANATALPYGSGGGRPW